MSTDPAVISFGSFTGTATPSYTSTLTPSTSYSSSTTPASTHTSSSETWSFPTSTPIGSTTSRGRFSTIILTTTRTGENVYTVSASNSPQDSPQVVTLITPDIAYCTPATLSWIGGNGPYTVKLAALNSDVSWPSPIWSTNSTTSQSSITIFNNIAPRFLLVQVTDSTDVSFSKALPVSGGGGTCMVGGLSATNAASTPSSALSPGTVAGIVLGCLAALAVLCVVFWRRILASRRSRVRVVPFEQRNDLGARHSITSAGSTRWSTFTGRTAAQQGNALHTDMQDVEEGRSPISAPTSKRAKGQPPVWASAQSLPIPSPVESETPSVSDELYLLGPGTEMTRSSVSSPQDRSFIHERSHSGTGSMRSPFDDDQSAMTLSGGFNPDEKTATPLKTLWPPRERLADAIAAIRNGDHSPLSAHPSNGGDASPLSSRDLETLADLVAARLTQREGPSSRRTRSSNGSEMPPRYS